MLRTLEEQKRTHAAFFAEIAKAPNAVEILRLYNQILDDGFEREKESFAAEKQLVASVIAQKDKVIAGLQSQLHQPWKPTRFASQRRRWN